MIDLRSDTVTRPTPPMRAAMAAADVGDDVYGEDPTVNRLQEEAAALFGKEAALLCPSGIMCNQLWLKVLADPGDEVLVEADAHVVNYEGGAGAALAGVQFRTVAADRGVLTPDVVRPWVRRASFPLIGTSVIAIEETHNRRGGTCYTVEDVAALRGLADEVGASLYCDGARIFNAAVALEVSVAELVAPVDGLMFCLSKALSAPVGSVMVGSADAIDEARAHRARYGGGMRQAGVLAAAGLVALEQMVDRLADDHEHARRLAAYAADAAPDLVDPARVETNIVAIEGVHAARAVVELERRGVRAIAMDPATLRLVTHPDVNADDCERAGTALREVLSLAEVTSGQGTDDPSSSRPPPPDPPPPGPMDSPRPS